MKPDKRCDPEQHAARRVLMSENRGRRTPPEREGRHGIAFCIGRESKTDRCRIACIVTHRCRRVFRITLLGEDFPNSYPGAWDFPVLMTTATAITRGSRLPQGRLPAARSATSGAACGNSPAGAGSVAETAGSGSTGRSMSPEKQQSRLKRLTIMSQSEPCRVNLRRTADNGTEMVFSPVRASCQTCQIILSRVTIPTWWPTRNASRAKTCDVMTSAALRAGRRHTRRA